MPKFRFSLGSVLQLRNRKRDECRRELGQAISELRQIESRNEAVLNEQAELRSYLKELSKGGIVEINMVSRCHMHLAQLERCSQKILLESEAARLVVDGKRRNLVEADQQVKALEKLCEKQFEEFQHEQDRRERLEQDEILAANRPRKLLP